MHILYLKRIVSASLAISYGRALGPAGKLLFFVLATFYLIISTFITGNYIKSKFFDFIKSKFRLS